MHEASGAPTWIGDRGVFGSLHLPVSGTARSGLLICPSLAAEQTWAHGGLRELATRLASVGFAVLRFDYRGTGYSAGDIETDAPSLIEDTLEAHRYLLSTGVPAVSVLAFGAGSLVAAEALRSVPVDRLVLWEPAGSYRRWSRQQRALLTMGSHASSAPRQLVPSEVAGLLLPRSTEQMLESWTGQWAGRPAGTTLVASSQPRIREQAEALPAEAIDAVDTHDLLYTESLPTTTIERIVEWLTRSAATEEHPVAAPGEPVSRVAMRAPDGEEITETLTTLPGGYFAVATAGAGAPAGGAVVFLGSSTEPAVGPGRAWVRSARRAAAAGRPAYRVDLPGFGETAARPGQNRQTAFPEGAVDDVLAIVAEVSEGHPESVTVVGLSSAGYHALEAGWRTRIGHVFAVNPSQRPRRVSPLVPVAARKVLRAVRSHASPPVASVRPVLDRGTRVTLVCGSEDPFWAGRSAARTVAELSQTGLLEARVIPELGHSGLSNVERRLLEGALASVLDGGRAAPAASAS